jgi:hypothetical protein
MGFYCTPSGVHLASCVQVVSARILPWSSPLLLRNSRICSASRDSLDEGRLMHRYGISNRLTELCGAIPQVMVKRCDKGGGPEDWTWIFSLEMDYEVPKVINLSESFGKYCKIVNEAFGSPHVTEGRAVVGVQCQPSPSHGLVSIQLNAQSIWFPLIVCADCSPCTTVDCTQIGVV